jgi:hypothetical protein
MILFLLQATLEESIKQLQSEKDLHLKKEVLQLKILIKKDW